MMPRHTEKHMRVSALLAYTVAALWVSWTLRESAWAVLHLSGAIAGFCALSLAVSYAGLIGQATESSDDDQARTYMEMEDWDG